MRIDHSTTSGTFSLDGQTFEVENNVWVIGDDSECVVIDAPHDVNGILATVGGRRVRGILLTHAHDDHARIAPALAVRLDTPVLLHPDDKPLWDLIHPWESWDVDLRDGFTVEVAGVEVVGLHTPGHSPGAMCFYVPALDCVFSGDTLFCGGPGATGRSFSDRGTLVESIQRRLFALPAKTVVHTGHGGDTTIGAEILRLEAPLLHS